MEFVGLDRSRTPIPCLIYSYILLAAYHIVSFACSVRFLRGIRREDDGMNRSFGKSHSVLCEGKLRRKI